MTTKQQIKKTTHANRGMKFEAMLIEQCEVYENDKEAIIHKLPTEFKIVRKGGRIVSAFPVAKSKLDMYGVLKNGQAVYIEAKSAEGKTSVPFSNISNHQLEYMNLVLGFTNYVYLILELKHHEQVFLINANKALEYIFHADRKSFPIDWIRENGEEVFYTTLINNKGKRVQGVDFLPIINKHIESRSLNVTYK